MQNSLLYSKGQVAVGLLLLNHLLFLSVFLSPSDSGTEDCQKCSHIPGTGYLNQNDFRTRVSSGQL